LTPALFATYCQNVGDKKSTAHNGQAGLSSTGALVALRIDKDALLPKIRLFERSEFSNFG